MTLPLVPAPASVRRLDGAARAVTGRSRTAALDAAWREADVLVDDALAAEEYALRVDATGISVRGGAPAALSHARSTLRQLLTPADDGWALPSVEIDDAPRFAYRGLMLDVARHFFDVDTVAWLIDRSSELKLTHLHLHLTDDHGWRLALASHPELAAIGASTSAGGDAGGHYTLDDWNAILDHAASRHITVVPEIDLPGHTHAVGLSHPELVADPVITDEVRRVTAEFGGELPMPGAPYTGLAVGFSSLRAGSAAVRTFLTEVLQEVCSITPGPYVHIGGDEAHGTDPSDYAELVGLAARVVAEAGKTPIAWHEAGRAPLPAGTVGQYWGFTTASADEAARLGAFVDGGGRIILSPADAVYLDMKDDERSPIGLTWANGPTSLERSYRWQPSAVAPGLDDDAILGVEAALWTETIRTRADIERMVFPRIAAAAEHAWSPASATTDDADFRRRIVAIAELWREEGIGFGPIVIAS